MVGLGRCWCTLAAACSMSPVRAAVVLARVGVSARWAFDRQVEKDHRDSSDALEDVKCIFGRLTYVTANKYHTCVIPLRPSSWELWTPFCLTVLPNTTPPPHSSNYRFEDPLPMPSPRPPTGRGPLAVLPAGLAVSAAALASNPHADVPPSHRKALCNLVSEEGVNFTRHPMWLEVTTAPPHRAVVVRLAQALGLPSKVPWGGYHNADDFKVEITGFVAWWVHQYRAGFPGGSHAD